jgi:hypothetical protein
MAKSQQLNFTQNLRFGANTIAAADTTTAKLLYTGNTDGSVVKSIVVTSLDTTARTIQLYANNGGTYFLLGSAAVPAGSGANGTVATVDLLSSTFNPATPYDANGKRVLPLPTGLSIYANSTATVANTIFITVFAEDY